MDETESAELSDEFQNSRIVFSTIMIDNYDEILNGLAEKDKASLVSAVDDVIMNWSAGYCLYDSLPSGIISICRCTFQSSLPISLRGSVV